MYSCIFDTHEGRFIDRIILDAGEVRIDLEDLFEAVAKCAEWFQGWYGEVYQGEQRHATR